MVATLGLEPNTRLLLVARRLPLGESCSLRVMNPVSLEESDQRAMLEAGLSRYTTLTQGSRITIAEGTMLDVFVSAVEPGPACCIINTDMAVDLQMDLKPAPVPDTATLSPETPVSLPALPASPPTFVRLCVPPDTRCEVVCEVGTNETVSFPPCCSLFVLHADPMPSHVAEMWT
eukprot:m.166910 g.166910  ORF g.166910 m.166910 type:complete len:175 (+) comp15244_c0_seq43:311-835(+)